MESRYEFYDHKLQALWEQPSQPCWDPRHWGSDLVSGDRSACKVPKTLHTDVPSLRSFVRFGRRSLIARGIADEMRLERLVVPDEGSSQRAPLREADPPLTSTASDVRLTGREAPKSFANFSTTTNISFLETLTD